MRAIVVVLVLCGAAHADTTAVDESLKWLAARQRKDGSWGDQQLTARVLVAFLWAGEIGRGTGPHGEPVRNARRFLVAPRKQSLRVGPRGRAMVAFALSQAYWLTRSARHKKSAQSALNGLARSDDVITAAWTALAANVGSIGGLRVDPKLTKIKLVPETARERAALLAVRAVTGEWPLQKEGNEVVRSRDELDHEGELFACLALWYIRGDAWNQWTRGSNERKPTSVFETACYAAILGMMARRSPYACVR